ncbi:MAG TPA: formate--tetrahydrofolate ligase [Candidatus Acetothermia bacterium]|nr:formate--tetrahydrofolate ligase [Candidatus Acetothermia bacterium]
MFSDLEIARRAKLRPIWEVAEELGLRRDELVLYGDYKAKVKLSAIAERRDVPQGKYIVVTAITPTPLGEGKTVTAIGLAQALRRLGKRAIVCIRQPSMGPVFGIKGGATGGGYAQVVPMDEINLHFTGDMHAVSIAHNLACAFLDNHLKRGNALDIDVNRIYLRRVVDLCDRWALEDIVIGLGGGYVRRSGFDISAASELMAILALAVDLRDLRERIGRMVVAFSRSGKPITCEDLKVAGAMAALMRDALMPNLVQTLEGGPAFVHAGPFANIAHGNSSVVADMLALRLGEYVVTEAGFGTDMGFEKLADIKCRVLGRGPDAAVVVATVRALKVHSGRFRVRPGRPLPRELLQEDPEAVAAGAANLEKHIENVLSFGIPVVVAINRFPEDHPSEIQVIVDKAIAAGASAVAESRVWEKGGEGGLELAEAVMKAAEVGGDFRYLYPLDLPLEEKIRTIARRMYGAADVEFSRRAQRELAHYQELGWGKLPVCMAKTHLSLSHDPALVGRPRGFVLPVREVRPAIGAGFLYPICGEIRTIPGLPTHPAGEGIDIDPDGTIRGLF